MTTHHRRQLSAADQARALGVLRDLYRQSEPAALREYMVGAAVKLIDADYGSFSELSKPESRVMWSRQFPDVSHVVERHFPAFAAHFHQHPVLQFARRTGRGDTQRSSDLCSERVFWRTELYNEYFRPIHVRWQMIFSIERPGGLTVAVALNRSDRDFTVRDCALFELLRPHYRQALENVTRLAGLRTGLGGIERAHAPQGHGTLVVNGDGIVQWISATARCSLEAAIGGWAEGARLPEDLRRWWMAQRCAYREGGLLAAPPQPLRFVAGDHAVTVKIIAQDEEGNATLDVAPERPHELALALPELTPRENEILGWISKGKSNPEIATILTLSVRTVYKHVENIFRKLGVENRACAMLRALQQTETGRLPCERTMNR